MKKNNQRKIAFVIIAVFSIALIANSLDANLTGNVALNKLGGRSFCKKGFPGYKCGVGEGDCDRDNECQKDLECYMVSKVKNEKTGRYKRVTKRSERNKRQNFIIQNYGRKFRRADVCVPKEPIINPPPKNFTEPAKNIISYVDFGKPILLELNDGKGVFSTLFGSESDFPGDSPDVVRAETSLTSAENDYETDVVIEVDRDSIDYRANIPEVGGILNKEFSIAGYKFKVLRAIDKQTMVIEENWSGGDGTQRFITAGNNFFNEDPDNPDWVWNLGNLRTKTPIIGIENDFIYNDDSDRPPKVGGECLELPRGHGKICLKGLTNEKSNTYTIEYDSSADLSDADTLLTSAKTIFIHTPKDRGIELIAPSRGTVATNKVWIIGNGRIFYSDRYTNKVKYLMTISKSKELATIGKDLKLDINNLGNEIDVIIYPKDEREKLTSRFGVRNRNIFGLGNTASLEEADELVWGPYEFRVGLDKRTLNIGTYDEDHRSAYGIIIRNPKLHGASDEVVLEIPETQIKTIVEMKFNNKSPPDPSLKCLDSDGGKNYVRKGIVQASNLESEGKTDVCYDKEILVEFYCKDNLGREQSYHCVAGCLNGACLPGRLPGPIEPPRRYIR